MLKYLKSIWKSWERFVDKYFERLIVVLIHTFIIISVSYLMCTRMHCMGFEILIYVFIYILLQAIIGYARFIQRDDMTQLSELKHDRFTKETSEGLIRIEKHRLSEMIQFVYEVEEIQDDLYEVKK